MAFVPQFEHDLFVSYRRIVDEGPDPWVSSFTKQLESSLKVFGCEAKFWRDKVDLRTGTDWRDVLTEALEKTAIYLAVISRDYLESRECRLELNLMLGALRTDSAKGQRSIFPVFMQPPKRPDDVPTELKALNQQRFFEPSDSEPLGFRELSALDFQRTMTRLAQELTAALELLRGAVQTEFRGRVFLADVGPALYGQRDELCSDLRDHRFQVVPRVNYISNSVDTDGLIRADLHEAALAIHLVAPAALRSEAEVEHARQQLKLAVEVLARQGRPPPVVWMPTRADAQPPLQEFLAEIDVPFADQGVELVTGGIEELKTLVYKRLGAVVPVPASAPVPAPGMVAPTVAAPFGDDVVVLLDEGDAEAFGARRAWLFEQLDVEAVPVRLHGVAAPDTAALALALAASPRCLIYWGVQPESWLQQVLRLPQLADRLRPDRLAVLVEEPHGAEKQQFLTRKALVVRAVDQAGPALRTFLGRA